MVTGIGQSHERRRRLRSGSAGHAREGLVRCACQRCGSHVQAIVLKQTISGLCGTCGSCDIARLGG